MSRRVKFSVRRTHVTTWGLSWTQRWWAVYDGSLLGGPVAMFPSWKDAYAFARMLVALDSVLRVTA